jgi:hypothetical protein
MSNKVLRHFLGLILAGLASATWALAQPMGQPPNPAAPGGGSGPIPGIKRPNGAGLK